MNTANTILNQLGANKFIVMTGVKNLMADADGLTMKLPKCKTSATHLSIQYNKSTDTYTMVWIRVRNFERKVTKELENVYADMLQGLFTEETGMLTSLGTMGKNS